MSTSDRFAEARQHLSKAALALRDAYGNLEGPEREAAEMLHADVGSALRRTRNFESITGARTRGRG